MDEIQEHQLLAALVDHIIGAAGLRGIQTRVQDTMHQPFRGKMQIVYRDILTLQSGLTLVFCVTDAFDELSIHLDNREQPQYDSAYVSLTAPDSMRVILERVDYFSGIDDLVLQNSKECGKH